MLDHAQDQSSSRRSSAAGPPGRTNSVTKTLGLEPNLNGDIKANVSFPQPKSRTRPGAMLDHAQHITKPGLGPNPAGDIETTVPLPNKNYPWTRGRAGPHPGG